MTDPAGTELVDARGMKCPWPVVRLARALRQGAVVVDLIADDPAAPAEVAAFAVSQGLALAAISTRIGPGWRLSSGG